MNQIKELRVAAGLTQEQLALKLGIGQTAVANWESGRAFPRTSLLSKMASVLNCELNDLFKDKVTEHNKEGT